MLRREIETSTKSLDDPEHLQGNIEQLHSEIASLAEAARTKEHEWNNILYLKKMKEDILMRLTRQKTVLEIMSNKSIDDPESLCAITEDPANNIEPKSSSGTALTSYILSRSNMKSADLAKEQNTISSLNRLANWNLAVSAIDLVSTILGFFCGPTYPFKYRLCEKIEKTSKTSTEMFGAIGIVRDFYR